VRELDRTEGQPGANALLTIDLDLQRFAAERMKEHQSGSVVVLDVVTGDVVVMAVDAGFDPNTFARGITQSEWREPARQPGAAVAQQGDRRRLSAGLDLQDGDGAGGAGIQGDRSVDAAALRRPSRARQHQVPLLAEGGHGSTNVVEAITHSCDCFFYEAARKAGIDRIADVGARLGFGRLSELGLPGESTGIQPSRAWKQEKLGKPWQHGDTFNLGIGQGFMNCTPLQLAIMTAASPTVATRSNPICCWPRRRRARNWRRHRRATSPLRRRCASTRSTWP
jgi:penicillin-binding protein 2